MSKFIGYTVGLDCNGHGQVGKLMMVMFSRLDDGRVKLTACSARNLSETEHTASVSAEQYEDRPGSDEVGGEIKTARWALSLCGYSLMADDYEESR